jgi:glycosyltransferase involved in cell wall biosynthesis
MDRPPAVVLSTGTAHTALGRDSYSYSFAVRQFRPLLARWGLAVEVNQSEDGVERAVSQLRREGRTPLHLGFSPLHAAYLARDAANAAFIFWEYPNLPQRNTADDPRYDWARVAPRFDRILTASAFTRDAFRRAGVTVPIDVVPVPVLPDRFEVPDWRPGQSVALDVPAYIFHRPPGTSALTVVGAPPPPTLAGRLKAFYRACIRPLLPAAFHTRLRGAVLPPIPLVEGVPVPVPCQQGLDLSGVVYLHVCNPYDGRKNWQALVAAFLDALGDRPDALLVIKLVANGSLLPHAINEVNKYYLELDREHRCRIALIGGYLSDEQMLQLTAGATYYATATRAEGANLPLMDALAGGRPALAPRHTSMLDYYEPGAGWVIPSTEEPAVVGVSDKRLVTRWHRVDSTALVEQFRESYEVANRAHGRYREMAVTARKRMRDYASLEQVWPQFRAALDALAGGGLACAS